MSKECISCKYCSAHQKNLLRSWVSDRKLVFSHAELRPNSKNQIRLLTKRHTEDLRTLTNQEWADILPVLKDSIAKIESAPAGYRIYTPIGEKGHQDLPSHYFSANGHTLLMNLLY